MAIALILASLAIIALLARRYVVASDQREYERQHPSLETQQRQLRQQYAADPDMDGEEFSRRWDELMRANNQPVPRGQ